MQATGSDGGRGPCLPWSYHRGDQIGSNSYSVSSSSSGTIVSTTTYTSRGSRLSSISMDAVRHFELALDEDTELVRPTKKSCKERERMNVLERWFSELDVAWVLHLPDGDDDASAELHHTAESWIRGLHRIMEAIRSTPTVLSGLPDVWEQEGQPVPESDKQTNNVPDQIHSARFTKEAMSKMLHFVDFAIRQGVVCTNGTPKAPYKKLHTLLALYKALSDARDKILSPFYSTSQGVASIQQETANLLSAKQEEAGDAIWSTMELIRTLVLGSIHIEYADDLSSSLMAQASSDIHKTTLSVMEYISFLCSNFSSMCQIVSKAVSLGKYVPQIRQEQPLDSMVMDMKSCLQKKLVKMLNSFPDQGLRFLFLLNNLEFIRQSLVDNHFWYWLLYHEEGEEDLSEKVEGYMENYLQACWEPVLSCLFSPTPFCSGINHSPLPKFESEFKKTYATQKIWKIPDPELRKHLRTAIIWKIVPRYTEYIEENNVSTPGVFYSYEAFHRIHRGEQC